MHRFPHTDTMPRPLRDGLRNRHLFALDLALLPLATLLAIVIRFEGLLWPPTYATIFPTYLAFALPVKLALLL